MSSAVVWFSVLLDSREKTAKSANVHIHFLKIFGFYTDVYSFFASAEERGAGSKTFLFTSSLLICFTPETLASRCEQGTIVDYRYLP